LFKVQKGITQWDPISFTVEYKIIYKKILFTIKTIKIKQKTNDLMMTVYGRNM